MKKLTKSTLLILQWIVTGIMIALLAWLTYQKVNPIVPLIMWPSMTALIIWYLEMLKPKKVVFNPRNSYVIPIKVKHIVAGIYDDAFRCPIALAIREYFNLKEFEVQENVTAVHIKHQQMMHDLYSQDVYRIQYDRAIKMHIAGGEDERVISVIRIVPWYEYEEVNQIQNKFLKQINDEKKV